MEKFEGNFEKFSLEERAKILLKDYLTGRDIDYNCSKDVLSETWQYLQDEKYINLVGETPKSGPSFGITGIGLKFIGLPDLTGL